MSKMTALEALEECSCCGELFDEDELNEDGMCNECYCSMFPEEF